MNPLIDVIALSEKHCSQAISGKLAYATIHNFTGQIVEGYHADALDIGLLTPRAALALCEVQNNLLNQEGLSLFIYDAYRPKRAVLHFLRWAENPSQSEFELEKKKIHYPDLEKGGLFAADYLSDDSGHCYGNTVDVVLVDAKTGKEVDMGSCFDFFGERSHLSATSDEIGKLAFHHRQLLMEAMTDAGFLTHHTEYWHFSHGGVNGREVSKALDIEITRNFKGLGVSLV